MIIAPSATVSAWRNESGRLLAASATPGLPAAVVEVLTHASRILMASAINAAAGGPEVFAAGLAELAKEVVAEQERDLAREAAGEPGGRCPIPEPAGGPRRCGCGPEGRAGCAKVAREIGENPGRVGGSLAADLDALVADDQARREGGQS